MIFFIALWIFSFYPEAFAANPKPEVFTKENINNIILVQEAILKDLPSVIKKQTSLLNKRISKRDLLSLDSKMDLYLSSIVDLIKLYFHKWYSLEKKPEAIKVFKKKHQEKINQLFVLCSIAIELNKQLKKKNSIILSKPYLIRAKHYETINVAQAISDYKEALKFFPSKIINDHVVREEPSEDVCLASIALHDLLLKQEKTSEALSYILSLKLSRKHKHYGYVLMLKRKDYILLKQFKKAVAYSEESVDFFRFELRKNKTYEIDLEYSIKDLINAWISGIKNRDIGFDYSNFFYSLKKHIDPASFLKYFKQSLVVMRSEFLFSDAEGFYFLALNALSNHFDKVSLSLEFVELKMMQKLNLQYAKKMLNLLKEYAKNLKEDNFVHYLKDSFEDRRLYFLQLCDKFSTKIKQDNITVKSAEDKKALEKFGPFIQSLTLDFKSSENKVSQMVNIAEGYVEQKKYLEALKMYDKVLRVNLKKDDKIISLVRLRRVALVYSLLLEKRLIGDSFVFKAEPLPDLIQQWLSFFKELEIIYNSPGRKNLLTFQKDLDQKMKLYQLEKAKILLSYSAQKEREEVVREALNKISEPSIKGSYWMLLVDALLQKKDYGYVKNLNEKFYETVKSSLTDSQKKVYSKIIIDSDFFELESLYLSKNYEQCLLWLQKQPLNKNFGHRSKDIYQIGVDVALALNKKDIAASYLKKSSGLTNNASDMFKSSLLDIEVLEEKFSFKAALENLLDLVKKDPKVRKDPVIASKLYQLSLASSDVSLAASVKNILCSEMVSLKMCSTSEWAQEIIGALNAASTSSLVNYTVKKKPSSKAMAAMLDLLKVDSMSFAQKEALLRDILMFSKDIDVQLQSLFMPIFIEQFKTLVVSWSDDLIAKKVVSFEPKKIADRVKEVVQTNKLVNQVQQLPWMKARSMLWSAAIKLHYKVLEEMKEIPLPSSITDSAAFKSMLSPYVDPIEKQADAWLKSLKNAIQEQGLESSWVNFLQHHLGDFWKEPISESFLREDPIIFSSWLKAFLKNKDPSWLINFELALEEKLYSKAFYIIAQAKVKNIWDHTAIVLATSTVLAFMGAQSEALQTLLGDAVISQDTTWLVLLKTGLACSAMQGEVCRRYMQEYRSRLDAMSKDATMQPWIKRFNLQSAAIEKK